MLNIHSLCNKHCGGTIHNLSTYMCDRSWGVHKTFIHPLLFLKLGATRIGGGLSMEETVETIDSQHGQKFCMAGAAWLYSMPCDPGE